MVHFRNVEVTTPVVGKLGGLLPLVYPSIAVSTDVTNNPIEEKLRLTVVLHTVTVHFRHHEATDSRLMRRANFCEDVSMERSMLLFDLRLEWVGLFTYRLYWVLMGRGIRKGYWLSRSRIPVVR